MAERRLDPDDDQAYTRQEIGLKYKDFSPEDVEEYWARDCRPLTTSAPEGPDIPAHWCEDTRTDLPEGSKVFVSGLSRDVSADTLNDIFGLCGEVAYIQVCINQDTDEPRGFAKVQFASAEAAARSVRELSGGVVDGQAISVRPLLDEGKNVRIFVAGLEPDTTQQELEDHFSSCGEILFSQLFNDRGTLEPNGQGKVEYVFPESVEKAIQRFHGQELRGKRLAVQAWREGPSGRRAPGPLSFVARLHSTTTARSLRILAEATGQLIVDATVFIDRESGESRQFGKLEFVDEDSRQAATKELDGAYLDGHYISVREFDSAAGAGGRRASGPAVYVANLGYDVTERRLADFFGGCGQVTVAHVFMDLRSGGSKGSGRVEFLAEDAVPRAIELSGALLDGRPVVVREFGAPPPAARGGPEAGKVFVAGLRPETTAEDLREHFAACGEIVDAYVFVDRGTGASRRFAKVHFASAEAQQKAIDELNGSELHGRQIAVRSFGLAQPSGGQVVGTADPASSVFVAGLALSTTAETLRAFFADAGEVTDAFLYVEGATGRFKGVARVTFATAAAARTAVSLWNDCELEGRYVKVCEFVPSGAATGDREARGKGKAGGTFGYEDAWASRQAGRGGPWAPAGRGLGGKSLGKGVGGWKGRGKSGGYSRGRGAGSSYAAWESSGVPRAGAWQGEEARWAEGGRRGYDRSSTMEDRWACRGRREDSGGEGGLDVSEEEIATIVENGKDAGLRQGIRRGAESWDKHQSTRVGRWRGWNQKDQIDAAAADDSVQSVGADERDGERRVDPDDGKLYTEAELCVKYEGLCSTEEVREYWELDCSPLLPAAAGSDTRPPVAATATLGGGAASKAVQKETTGATADERRVDPDDGQVYTFAEVLAKYEDLCSEVDIRQYWDQDCQSLPRCESTAAAATSVQQEAAPEPPEDTVATPTVGTPVEAAAVEAAAAVSESEETAPAGRPLQMSLREWVAAVDHQWLRHVPEMNGEAVGVRTLVGVLEEHFDDVNQILRLYAKRGPDQRTVLADNFFKDVGIKKIGHKRMFNEWIRRNT